jgi:glycosyltransferase involved in cell wall biosynthesis
LFFFRYILFIFSKINKSYREEALKRGRNYLNKCLEGIIKNITFKNSLRPKISILVPVYNSQRTIKSAIRSIQNQNMIDIEIILINDFSKDNSSQIIEKIQEQDPRIIIMNNKKNMGILYSRSLGVLKSRGKYILNLDHDDMFFDEDVFDKIYQSSERGYYDIISFMEVQGDDYYINIKDMKDGICTNHPNNLIIRQPELSYYTLFKNEEFSLVDIQIWGKLFKTKVYKAAVNLLGKKRYSVFNAINEDMIGIFSICNIAQSYKYIRKYGLFHFTSNSTASQIISKDHYMEMEVFFCDVIFDLSIANSKKYSAIIAIRLKTMFYFSLSKDITKRYLLYVLKKILNSKFVEKKYKEKIIKEYKEFKLV